MNKNKNIIELIPVEDGLPQNYTKGKLKYYFVKIEGWFPNFGSALMIDGEWYRDFTSKYTCKISHWAEIN
jgi:hypothetical protein